MTRRPIQFVEQICCTYPLTCPSGVLSFSGRHREVRPPPPKKSEGWVNFAKNIHFASPRTLPPEGQQDSPPPTWQRHCAYRPVRLYNVWDKSTVALNKNVEGQIKFTHNEMRQWLVKGLHSVSSKVIKWISATVHDSVWSYTRTSGSQLKCVEHLGMYMIRGNNWEADTGKKVVVCEIGVVKSRSRQKGRQ